jgi:hypothetical protein
MYCCRTVLVTLALLADDLCSIIENVSEDDKTRGHIAWTALVNHYEDDGIYRCTEVLHNMDTSQADGESGILYLNRLVRVWDVHRPRPAYHYYVLGEGLARRIPLHHRHWDVHNLIKFVCW